MWKYTLYSQSITENMILYAKNYNIIYFHVVHDNDIATSYFITYYNTVPFWYVCIYICIYIQLSIAMEKTFLNFYMFKIEVLVFLV